MASKQPSIFNIIAKILLFCAVVFFSFQVGRMKSETKLVFCDTCDYYSKTILNWENIGYWLEYFDVKEIDIVMAQIKLETGNLTSSNCIRNNNLFGFTFAKCDSTATYKDGIYSGYPNFIESIKRYSQYQHRYYNGTENYYSFLRRVGYAEDSTYIQKLKSIRNGKSNY